ncbi:hypothetical protein QF037_009787 [Streptomyces canus]|nr:hypothetical protein [Streptomyces canus]
MSTAGWVYVPAGSGAGHLQRVASNTQFNRALRAYRAYIDHSSDCQTCTASPTPKPRPNGLTRADATFRTR